MMEIAYLFRMRANEVRALTGDHLLKEGVFVERGKNSKNEITLWSDRLRKAISITATLRKQPSNLLFCSRSGGKVPKTSFDSAWKRIRDISLKNGLTESFHYHDIKAKGITDHETKEGGHRSEKMATVYDRKPDTIKATR
jgi:integrase